MNEFINVEKADRIISNNTPNYPAVKIPLEKAHGMVLRENIYADRDFPPVNKALMDGIAVNYASIKKGYNQFIIEGIQSAGTKQLKIKNISGCVQIMTGAVLSKGCDTVIPIEHVNIHGKQAFIKENAAVSKGQFIQKQAADIKKGNLLIRANSILNPPNIAIAASVGKSRIIVTKKIKVAVISTGDEIISINKAAKPYQTRASNSYFIQSLLSQYTFFESKMFHIKDNKQVLLNKIRGILNKFDVLVLSGGVSMGKFDYVPEVLNKLKARQLFHKVRQRPGKPFWFGVSKNHQLIFALPGNPVSTQIGSVRYVIKHLKQILNIKDSPTIVKLKKPVIIKNHLTNFLPVTVYQDKNAQLWAEIVSFSGSGDLASLSESHGFIELSADVLKFKKGHAVRFYAWS